MIFRSGFSKSKKDKTSVGCGTVRTVGSSTLKFLASLDRSYEFGNTKLELGQGIRPALDTSRIFDSTFDEKTLCTKFFQDIFGIFLATSLPAMLFTNAAGCEIRSCVITTSTLCFSNISW